MAFEVARSEEGKVGTSKIEFKSIDFRLPEDQVAIQSANPVFKEHGHEAELKKWLNERLSQALH